MSEGLSSWKYKKPKEQVKEVEAEFGEDFVDVEEKKKMEEEKEIKEEEKEGKKEEKKYKDMTKEEQKERNIDILLGIGFQRSRDKGDGKERYTYKIDDNTFVGRTFNGKQPTGRFWAKKGDDFLSAEECKKLGIVKRFYAIREGTEKMPERPKEIAKKEERKEIKEQEIAVREEIKPNHVIMDAQRKADSLYTVVEKQHLFMQIRDKKYLTLEAWEILGKFCNLTAVVEWVKPVELWESRGFEARVIIKDNAGNVVSTAESMCMSDEPNWKEKPIFQLKSMAQTRAMSKAYRMCLSFIVSLAGYSPTPYEEMSE